MLLTWREGDKEGSLPFQGQLPGGRGAPQKEGLTKQQQDKVWVQRTLLSPQLCPHLPSFESHHVCLHTAATGRDAWQGGASWCLPGRSTPHFPPCTHPSFTCTAFGSTHQGVLHLIPSIRQSIQKRCHMQPTSAPRVFLHFHGSFFPLPTLLCSILYHPPAGIPS